jgi:iron(II)-dependent oxidoreductase
MPLAGPIAPTRRAYAELLAEARARTLLLVSPLSAEQMVRQPPSGARSVLSYLQSITQFEATWLLEDSVQPEIRSYDEWFDWMTELRQQVLQRLDAADVTDSSIWTERYRMVLEYEYHCGEAILQTIQLLGEPYTPVIRRRLPGGRRLADPGFMARFPGGTVEIGGTELSVWPEEEPAHRVTLPPFWIDVLPVTNGDFVTFMAAGGYSERSIWSEEGWDWVKTSLAQMPEYWLWQDGRWWSRRIGREAPIDLTCPVSHISYHEAEAFARFVGKRLPTEIEWEAAAAWDPEFQSRRHYPWGNMGPSPHVANLDQLAFEPAPVGAFPGNVSPIGCYGMVGDLWEWTASAFLPYVESDLAPPTLLRGRFGEEYRVLRGGSWASRPGAIRLTVRRPARPENRALFCGFRCARDITA